MTPTPTNDERLDWPFQPKSIDDATPAQWDAASRSAQKTIGQILTEKLGGKVQPAGSVGDINSDAKGSGARFNAGKPDLSLIPFRILSESYRHERKSSTPDLPMALYFLGRFQETGSTGYLYDALLALGPLKETWEACARVFDYGRKKYAAWNWAKGMAWSIPLACAGRHTLSVLAGEDTDPESGELHKGHIACNIVMALTFIRTFPEGNDLPKVLA